MKKRTITLLIAASMILGATVALAENVMPINDASVITSEETVKFESTYIKKTLTIKEIEENIYKCEDQDGQPAEVSLDVVNVFLDDNAMTTELKVGDSITVFQQATAPMVLSYPTRYQPRVVIKNTAEPKFSVNVDTYHKSEDFGEYVNSENTVAITVGDKTQINTISKIVFDGNLDGRDLVVFYDIATFSIPAQTTPKTVFVLDEQVEEEKGLSDCKTILAGDTKIDYTYYSDELTEYVPLRTVAEAIGFDVQWNDVIKSITLNAGYSMRIGENSYIKGRMVPIELEAAPVTVLTENTGVTYVPLSYFSEVLECEVSVDGDTIIINAN